MENIQFTFNHDSKTNFLEIIGTKKFNNKNYECGIRGKIDQIDLQEVLSRIEINMQNEIIEDLNKDNLLYITTKLTSGGLTSKIIAEKLSSELMQTCSGINIKFEGEKINERF